MGTIFVCHASEDKELIARPLALGLQRLGYQVWFDEFSVRAGDGLRRTIDEGLAKCDFGVVIISPYFFRKEWPQRELDGLTARETYEGRKLVLPVWHNVTRAEVHARSPMLADRLGIRGNDIGQIIDAIRYAVGDELKLRQRLEVLNTRLWNAIMMGGYDDGYDDGNDVMDTTNEIAALRVEIEGIKKRLG